MRSDGEYGLRTSRRSRINPASVSEIRGNAARDRDAISDVGARPVTRETCFRLTMLFALLFLIISESHGFEYTSLSRAGGKKRRAENYPKTT